jgi:hypothetical protein
MSPTKDLLNLIKYINLPIESLGRGLRRAASRNTGILRQGVRRPKIGGYCNSIRGSSGRTSSTPSRAGTPFV